MKRIVLFLAAAIAAFNLFAQNTLEVIDTGNITRELWRDSVPGHLINTLRKCPTLF